MGFLLNLVRGDEAFRVEDASIGPPVAGIAVQDRGGDLHEGAGAQEVPVLEHGVLCHEAGGEARGVEAQDFVQGGVEVRAARPERRDGEPRFSFAFFFMTFMPAAAVWVIGDADADGVGEELGAEGAQEDRVGEDVVERPEDDGDGVDEDADAGRELEAGLVGEREAAAGVGVMVCLDEIGGCGPVAFFKVRREGRGECFATPVGARGGEFGDDVDEQGGELRLVIPVRNRFGQYGCICREDWLARGLPEGGVDARVRGEGVHGSVEGVGAGDGNGVLDPGGQVDDAAVLGAEVLQRGRDVAEHFAAHAVETES